MQKVRIQVMLTANELYRLHSYMGENQLINESRAIVHILATYERLHAVIKQLEAKAQESLDWKERYEKKETLSAADGVKPTIKQEAAKKV